MQSKRSYRMEKSLSISSEGRNSKMFSYSEGKIALASVIKGSITVIALKHINNDVSKKRGNFYRKDFVSVG